GARRGVGARCAAPTPRGARAAGGVRNDLGDWNAPTARRHRGAVRHAWNPRRPLRPHHRRSRISGATVSRRPALDVRLGGSRARRADVFPRILNAVVLGGALESVLRAARATDWHRREADLFRPAPGVARRWGSGAAGNEQSD